MIFKSSPKNVSQNKWANLSVSKTAGFETLISNELLLKNQTNQLYYLTLNIYALLHFTPY